LSNLCKELVANKNYRKTCLSSEETLFSRTLRFFTTYANAVLFYTPSIFTFARTNFKSYDPWKHRRGKEIW